MINSKIRNVEDYILLQDSRKHDVLNNICSLIRSTIPKAEEVISYRIPCYKHFGLVVGFGVHKTGYSIYTMSTTILKEFNEELKNYRFGGSTLHIRMDQKLPVSVLRKIILKRYRYNEQRAATRKK